MAKLGCKLSHGEDTLSKACISRNMFIRITLQVSSMGLTFGKVLAKGGICFLRIEPGLYEMGLR